MYKCTAYPRSPKLTASAYNISRQLKSYITVQNIEIVRIRILPIQKFHNMHHPNNLSKLHPLIQPAALKQAA